MPWITVKGLDSNLIIPKKELHKIYNINKKMAKGIIAMENINLIKTYSAFNTIMAVFGVGPFVNIEAI